MKDTQQQIEIYQTENGQTEIQVRLENETVWLTQDQMAGLFGKAKSTINEHIKNIFAEGELEKAQVTQKFGNSEFQRNSPKSYNLDVIISVGYRVKSHQGTQFRIWATRRLKELLVRGYTLNQARLEQNAAELERALELIRKAAQSPELTEESGRGLVGIISGYTQTFLWLQRYDEGLLDEPSGQSGGVLPTAQAAMADIHTLKARLIARGEATELFARPREEGLAPIFGNLEQSVFGEPAYPTLESKAAHLLYFVVKNHPFIDGNKRSGAFLFVDFLHRNGRLLNSQDLPIINDTGLAALTLLVAESDPQQKETLIRLMMHMLAGSDGRED